MHYITKCATYWGLKVDHAYLLHDVMNYQAHALVGTIATVYALHNEVRYILGVKG